MLKSSGKVIPDELLYFLVLGGAVVLSAWLTAEMSRRKVSIGLKRFIVSTTGILTVLLVRLLIK